MHTSRFVHLVVGIACLLGLAGSAHAQGAPAAGVAATPAAAPAAAAPAPTPAAAPEGAAAAPAPESPAPEATPAAPPPPPPPPVEEVPPPPPPPPAYQSLGGAPEQAVEEGSWNPWDHPAPGRYSHDGFFLRLTLGFGGGSVGNDDIDWSGPSMGMGMAIGGSIVDNLALHADFQNTLVLSPTVETKGKSETFDGDLQLSSLGIGVTYYFMPINLYLSGAIGLGVTSFENNAGQQYDTSAGPVLNVLLGKEWWVGADWGVGVAAQLLVMSVKDDIDGKLTSGALNVLFTATYN
jgi:hypothetical protein